MGIDDIVNKITKMIKSFLFLCLLGIVPWLTWTVAKIVMWNFSPYKGSGDHNQVMTLSFSRMIWSPYSLGILWMSGFSFAFNWTIVYMMFHPEMPIWSDGSNAARWTLYSLSAVVTIRLLYFMVLEVFMIFSFRNWFYWMIEKGINPLA